MRDQKSWCRPCATRRGRGPIIGGVFVQRVHSAHCYVVYPGTPLHTPRVTCRRVVVSLRGPGQSPVLPFACCVGSLLSVGRCGRCSCWCRFCVRGAPWLVCWGAVLNVAGWAVCVSAAPNNWSIEDVLVVAGVV